MKTIRIKSGETVEYDPKAVFFLAQASLSIKKMGLSGPHESQTYRFEIGFIANSGEVCIGIVELIPPYYFSIYRGETKVCMHQGPYSKIELKSKPENPDLVIQLGFTNVD